MKKLSLLTIIATLTLFAGTASAVSLTPGEWTFISVSKIPMMPQPKTSETTKCFTQEEADRDPLAALVEDGNCTVTERKESGDTIDFEVECAGDGKVHVKTSGKGSFTVSGKTASGRMEVTMTMGKMPKMPNMPNMPQFGGGDMTMTQTWEGKYNGPCKK